MGVGIGRNLTYTIHNKPPEPSPVPIVNGTERADLPQADEKSPPIRSTK